MTRQEHLQRCKDTAMKYVERGELLEAVAMAMLGLLAMQQAQSGDRDGVVRYIKGFN